MHAYELSWAEAMRAERRGDQQSYDWLLKQIAALLRRLIRGRLSRLGISPDDAEDLVQEILIGIHTRRQSWDQDRPFMPWLFAVTRYKLIDAARRFRREASYRLDISAEEFAEMAAPAEDLDRTTTDIESYIADLPVSQRSVVRSLAFDGATVREIAQRMGVGEAAIRITFRRALSRLKTLAAVEG